MRLHFKSEFLDNICYFHNFTEIILFLFSLSKLQYWKSETSRSTPCQRCCIYESCHSAKAIENGPNEKPFVQITWPMIKRIKNWLRSNITPSKQKLNCITFLHLHILLARNPMAHFATSFNSHFKYFSLDSDSL